MLRSLALLLLAAPLFLAAQTTSTSDSYPYSSLIDAGTSAGTSQDTPFTQSEREAARRARHPYFDDNYHIGALANVGTEGIGLQLAYPLSPRIVLRGGGAFYRYTQSGRRGDASYDGTLQLGGARLALDIFPWRERRFHVSPLLIFASQTRAAANVNIVTNGATFDLEDGEFYTLGTEPVRGTARMNFRKTSPGLAFGFGNLTHGHGHWLFPVEFGFYYNSTANFQIDFTGTVCTANQPPATACRTVADNPAFQSALQQLRTEVTDNLHYTRFIPILNYGVGYRF